MSEPFHPLVKRLLDGELSLSELPPELVAQGAEALRLLGAVDRAPVSLPAALEARVMVEVRRRARSRLRRAWRWFVEPLDVEVRLRVRPWAVWGGALAAAAALAFLLARPTASPDGARSVEAAARDSVSVRFVLFAPSAKHVSVAGTFNQWDRDAAPLMRAGASGVWTLTLTLPVGQHQYAFVVDGERWVADPAAPGVDDGFGRQNSVVAVIAQGARTL
ncbi:MAG TPA: isoamylase early set domain-containing protein [Gemmatimonadales bacterium]|nr:isoamylase early set domain-containing protein [Gemmatimonadales bacterium]